MPCVHLKELYQLCQDQKLQLSSSDLIHIVCQQCEREEVCPSGLVRDTEDSGLGSEREAAQQPATDQSGDSQNQTSS